MDNLDFFSSFSSDLSLFCDGELQNSRRSSKVQIILCHERSESFSSGRLSTGSLRRLHHDWWMHEEDWRARAITTLWGQHSRKVSLLESLNRSPGENYHKLCCPTGLLCSGIQNNIAVSTLPSATLGSCPQIPQKSTTKAHQEYPFGSLLVLLPQQIFMSVLQSPIRASKLFFCAGHYSGMGITWGFWHLGHDWKEVMYVTKAVFPLKIVCCYGLWMNSMRQLAASEALLLVPACTSA